ncbi:MULTISPECIES: DUF3037 domain-containing protein [unclassified Pseudoalteromonas]|jgi:DNA-binding transcriptional MerR regulator|uniref:DUF3037 domain-containing protein n=1 Tax=unclassified Pseudoalteromonas TaxID=194690 RepID=UPI000C5B8270|nr:MULTISPECIES: DUF3037 domain-containing protein [unclassified Pseudoalteromonas]MBD56411.1 hypothetical protein [Pseudoalteromonas sp.]MCF2901078.1 DUF3037 domain-containing protein [Pseudoalteromonas sp. OFAV1]TMO42756.1 DUF3037 domain-containing protein [Pseudoalteromonas sp. S4389]|tara:strand:+ start:841 stop:1686 length:846 start_codon:yes stop_codon:yes gene_type:complete
MKNLCKYSIIRFMPFSETQEFANVGILLFSPKTGFVDYKLAPKSFGRVTEFFDDLNGELYKSALVTFEKELTRVKSLGSRFYGEQQVKLLEEVTRFREGIVSFSETRAVLHEAPQIALEQLYNKYIARNFVTKEYREQQMVKALRQDLKDNIRGVHYTQQKLPAGLGVQIDIPFVTKGSQITKAIKPLSFNQTKPLALIEHGEQWINRVRRLIQAGAIEAQNMLFTLEKPKSQKTEFLKAYDEVTNEMEMLNTKFTLFEDRKSIYSFATSFEDEEFKLIST